MGESACLMRSYSHPSDIIPDSKEGDPIRALGESVSFGRFMSESLAWEKWSSFSHNRYLEEAEKFSKPGSVAQKKAYFEAHYKRIAAAKKAAALLEEANAAVNDVIQLSSTNEVHNASSVDSESINANIDVAIDRPEEIEVPNTDLVSSVDTNGCNPTVERYEFESTKMEGAESLITENAIEENNYAVEDQNQLGNDENKDEIVVIQEEKTPIKEAAADQEILASTSKKKLVIYSSKPLTSTRKTKLPSPVKITIPVQPRKESNVTPKGKKFARNSVDKKRSIPNSLHMSINFGTQAGEISGKTSSIAQKLSNSRFLTARMSKDSSTLQTRTLASVTKESKQTSVNPMSETIRTRTLLGQSYSGSRTTDGNWHSSLFKDHSKSSSVCESNARSSTVSSPFSFRSEERAAKRKEFYQKLEEKKNAIEAENVPMPTKAKEKGENGLKDLRRSFSFRTKPISDFKHDTVSQTNHIKIPPTHPRLPKLGKKPTISTAQDTSSRPPRRPMINGSNPCIRKNNQTPTRSVTSLQKKNTRENASPNILV